MDELLFVQSPHLTLVVKGFVNNANYSKMSSVQFDLS